MKIKPYRKQLIAHSLSRQETLALFRQEGQLQGRHYWRQGELHFAPHRFNIETIHGLIPDGEWLGKAAAYLKDVIRVQETENIDVDSVELTGYRFRTRPWEHQLTALKKAHLRLEFAFLMEQGTGKSKTAIDEAAFLWSEEEIDCMIIAAPNGVHQQWIEEQLPEHCPIDFEGYAYVAGDNRAKKNIWNMVNNRNEEFLKVIAINLETLSVKSGEHFLASLLEVTGDRVYFLIDEASRVKSKSKRTKTLIDISGKVKYRRIASGTPITSAGVLDLYYPFQFLNPNLLGHRSFYTFREEFCRLETQYLGDPHDPNTRNFQKVIGMKNLDRLQQRLKAHSFRIRTDDCTDLPPISYMTRYIPLTKEERDLYNQLVREYFLEKQDGTIVPFKLAIVRMNHAAKILRGFLPRQVSDSNKEYTRINSNRQKAVVDFLAETGRKAAVWYWFVEEREAICDALRAAQIGFTCYGSGPAGRRAVEEIRENPDCQVFLSHPQSGGIGLNLQVCSISLWPGPMQSVEQFLQANSRIHRPGQKENTSVVTFLSQDTSEKRWYDRLYEQANVASMLLDDVSIDRWDQLITLYRESGNALLDDMFGVDDG